MNHILDGIVVLDLGRFIAAPYCGMLLADMGAEVIKIEKTTGEDGRGLPPFSPEGVNLYVPTFARNKKGISLNLRTEKAKKILGELIDKADVVLSNFRPGIMEEMGYSYEEIHKRNPRAVVAFISGYGQTGKYADRGALDMIIQAASGMMSVTGTEESGPMISGAPIVDQLTGTFAALGIVSALYERKTTGVGKFVDISMLECAISIMQTTVPNYSVNGAITGRQGNCDPLTCPVNSYKAKDGEVMIYAGTNILFPRLAVVIKDQRLAKPEYMDVQKRIEDREFIDGIVGKWCSGLTVAEIMDILSLNKVPCHKVNNMKDIFEDPAITERGTLVDIDVTGVGPVKFGRNPLRFSEGDDGINHPAPTIGRDNEEIYGQMLGFDAATLDELKRNGII